MQRHTNPLLPLSVFRIKGLAAANATQLIALAGLLSMFLFLTLYMQNVLHYSAIQTGLAYLPLCFGVGIAAGVASKLIARIGTRPVIVTGALIAAGGLYYLSRMPAVHGTFLSDLLPGMMIVSLGLGAVFVGVTTAANAGVPADKAGLAAALLNASQQVGGALGLAVLSALATARAHNLLAAHASQADALTSGFGHALLVGGSLLVAAAVIALRTSNTREDTHQRLPDVLPAVRSGECGAGRPGPEGLRAALEGSDVAISGVGPRGRKDGPVASSTTRGMLHAMEASGIRRIVAVSAVPVGPVPKGANVPRGYAISRADVAHLMLAALENPATVRQAIGIAY